MRSSITQLREVARRRFDVIYSLHNLTLYCLDDSAIRSNMFRIFDDVKAGVNFVLNTRHLGPQRLIRFADRGSTFSFDTIPRPERDNWIEEKLKNSWSRSTCLTHLESVQNLWLIWVLWVLDPSAKAQASWVRIFRRMKILHIFCISPEDLLQSLFLVAWYF